ncbi:hypothetical protein ACH5RR_009551 [Cinchona calisaya]|uniref:Glabrous enhancer-binding protein-like DBD domain-containing protein n=1 Tax=Cinchona calisaya TaxID=153742 RepID=A0ABD3AF07_9GENT
MNVFVNSYLRSNADPELVRQRIDNLEVYYMARRHMLERGRDRAEIWPLPVQEIYALSHRLWSECRYSESETNEDETNLYGPPVFHDSTSLDEPSSVHGRQVVDQTNQASTSRTHHSHDFDTPTPNPSPSAAENSPEKSYSAHRSNNTNVSPDEDTSQTSSSSDQSNTSTIVSSNSVSFPSRNSKDSATSSMTKRRRLFKNLPTTTAQDINILTKMAEYSKANNEVYPSVSAKRLSDFVKNWLHNDADPGQVGKRIQELREMYGKYLMNNNNDEGGRPVYSDSLDDRLLLDLSKKLWHPEFGNPNDDSSGGNSSGDKS